MWLRTRGPDAVSDAVAACRRSAGLTQVQLAQRLRINRTTVIDMEAGRTGALRRAAEALSMLGYDLVVVPRGAHVTVVEESADSENPTATTLP